MRDHLQDVLLSAIYNSIQEAGQLIFKGGTAIRKIYGIDRYSDDLDFNLNTANLAVPADEFVYSLRNKCIATLAPLYETRMHIHKVHLSAYSIDTVIKDIDQTAVKIHIEITPARLYLPPMEKRVLTQDSTYLASVMSRNEILAEKIRAVYTRRVLANIARDMVDMSFLAQAGGGLDIGLVNEKLREVKHKPFSVPSFSKRIKLITNELWHEDLDGVMQHVPDRGETIKDVMEFVSE